MLKLIFFLCCFFICFSPIIFGYNNFNNIFLIKNYNLIFLCLRLSCHDLNCPMGCVQFTRTNETFSRCIARKSDCFELNTREGIDCFWPGIEFLSIFYKIINF